MSDPEDTTEFEALPDDASCKGCVYSEQVRAPGPEIGKTQRVCRRFPPAVFAVSVIQGGQSVGFQVSATPTPVDDKTWCWEYEARPDGEVETPGGLLIPPKV